MTFNELESSIKKGDFKNCYIFCGVDEELISKAVKTIVSKAVEGTFKDLNYIKFDGSTVTFDAVMNACETLPLMSERKVVVVSRAEFLKDGKAAASDKDNTKAEGQAAVSQNYIKYIDKIPEHCILIMYYAFENDREKISNKVKKTGEKAVVIEFNKLKGAALEKTVRNLFAESKREIGKPELNLFCSLVDASMKNVINEVEKLCCYTYGREITKEDIFLMLPYKNDNDIFNLVDFISQKRPEKALDALSELLYRGDKIPMILNMIERQFKLLLSIKLGIEGNKGKEILSSELKLHPYICEKMMSQSSKFTFKQLKNNIELCLEAERMLKTSTTNIRTEMEMLIVRTLIG